MEFLPMRNAFWIERWVRDSDGLARTATAGDDGRLGYILDALLGREGLLLAHGDVVSSCCVKNRWNVVMRILN